MAVGRVVVLAIAAVVVGSLVLGRDLPAVPVSDKFEHFAAYAVLAAGAVQLFARRASWAFVCLLLVLMGIGWRSRQAEMALGRMLDRNDAPGQHDRRAARPGDVVDALAGCAAAARSARLTALPARRVCSIRRGDGLDARVAQGGAKGGAAESARGDRIATHRQRRRVQPAQAVTLDTVSASPARPRLSAPQTVASWPIRAGLRKPSQRAPGRARSLAAARRGGALRCSRQASTARSRCSAGTFRRSPRAITAATPRCSCMTWRGSSPAGVSALPRSWQSAA